MFSTLTRSIHHSPGFLTIDIWGQITLCCEVLFSSILNLEPLDASSTHPPSCDNQKWLYTLPWVPRVGGGRNAKSLPVKNHCPEHCLAFHWSVACCPLRYLIRFIWHHHQLLKYLRSHFQRCSSILPLAAHPFLPLRWSLYRSLCFLRCCGLTTLPNCCKAAIQYLLQS